LNSLNKEGFMFRNLLFISATLFIFGCSSSPKKNISAKKVEAYEFKTMPELKLVMEKLLDEHPELDAKKRSKLKFVLQKGLDHSYLLKQRESQVAQVYLEDILVKQASEKELDLVIKEMRRIYAEKLNNLLDTFSEVNTILGRGKENAPIVNDFRSYYMDVR